MQDAKSLLVSHLRLIANNHTEWRALYADHAVMEFPYASSINAPGRYEGIEIICKHIQTVFSGLREPRIHSVHAHALEDGQGAMAEFEMSATVASTNLPYNQKYIALLRAENGKIVFLREYWNPQEVLKSFGGTAPGGNKPTA
jgi:ketosteroid isomerase-like protein